MVPTIYPVLWQMYVGKYCRSVESNWLGKVLDVEKIDGQILLKMKGVDELGVAVLGLPIEECLCDDDIQWFAPDDVTIVTVVEV